MGTKVELIPAFFWICPECGVDNFERAVIIELTHQERKEIAENNDIDEEVENGDIMSYPEEVECSFCQTEYETEEFGLEV